MSVISTVSLTVAAGDSSSTNFSKQIQNLTYTGSQFQFTQTQTIGCAAPTGLAAVPSASGGSLSATTYYYKATALNGTGETIASNEASATTTGSTGSVALSWTAVTGATSYRIYRGTSAGGESVYFTSSTNSFTDVGGSSTSGTVPGSNTTGTTWTPSLTVTPLQVFYVRNLGTTGTATIAWTPTGGSSQTTPPLQPNGAMFFLEPVSGTTGGITAFTVTVTAPGTPVEAFWVA